MERGGKEKAGTRETEQGKAMWVREEPRGKSWVYLLKWAERGTAGREMDGKA